MRIQTKVRPQGWVQSMPMYYIMFRDVPKIKCMQRLIPWRKVQNYIGCYNDAHIQEMLFWSFEQACEIAEDFQKHPDKLEKHITHHNKLFREHKERHDKHMRSNEAKLANKRTLEKEKEYNKERNSRYISKKFS